MLNREDMNRIHFLKPLSIKGKIRLGNNRDGGYVVYKKLLPKTDMLLSYGVGWDTAFEKHFNHLTGKKVLMFDPTMFGKYLFSFHKFKSFFFRVRLAKSFSYMLYIWNVWKEKKRLEAKKIFFINEGVATAPAPKYDTVASHMQRFELQGKRLFLKVDIEGTEYSIFGSPAIYRHLRHVNQLVIEFHDLKNRLRELQSILNRLSKEFSLIHVHGNNCGDTFVLYDLLNEGQGDIMIPDTLEVTLVRKTEIDPEDIIHTPVAYPVKDLDFPNDPYRQDYALAFI